jgi:hypothetical protein
MISGVSGIKFVKRRHIGIENALVAVRDMEKFYPTLVTAA